ncbi:MAG: TlpA family protein disulfide reductase [Candidatus Methylomirabilia bacterium]
MTMKKLTTICAVGAFLVSATVCFAADPAAAPAAPAVAAPAAAPAVPAKPAIANKIGVAVPAWEGALAGETKTINSSAMSGKAYGVVFVNSSCSACRGELGDLMSLKFNDSFSMLVAAVDVKLERTVATYRNDLGVTYPIIDDSKFAVARVFGIGFTPATVIVGKDGKVEFWSAGYTAETKEATVTAFAKYGRK